MKVCRGLCLIALIVSSPLMLAACANPSKEPPDLNEFLITEGIALTCNMRELAESKDYVALMSASDAIRRVVYEMASQDYGMPENAYLVKLSDDILLTLTATRALAGATSISDDVLEILKHKIDGFAFANMINGSHGPETIAATAMTTWGKSYVQPDGWSDDTVLYLEYPGEFSSIVSFVQSGDGVVSASSVFVKNGDRDILASLGLADTEYEHYSNSQLRDLLAK